MILGRTRGTLGARRGFTLLELLLVLALLAALSAMAWPSVNSMFDTQRLGRAADTVRAAWSRARYDALNSGRTMVFAYSPESELFTTEPWQGEAAAAAGETPDETSLAAPVSAAVEGRLPDGIVFVSGEMQSDTRTDVVAGSQMSQNANSIGVLFYPDGTTSTARVWLKNGHEKCILVELRGLTGISTVGEITSSGGQ